MPSKYSKPENLTYKQLIERLTGRAKHYKEQGWDISKSQRQASDTAYLTANKDRLWQDYIDSIRKEYPIKVKCRHCLIEINCAHRALGLAKGEILNHDDIIDLISLYANYYRHNACSPVCLSHIEDETDTTTKLEQSKVGEEHQATLRAYDAKYGRN